MALCGLRTKIQDGPKFPGLGLVAVQMRCCRLDQMLNQTNINSTTFPPTFSTDDTSETSFQVVPRISFNTSLGITKPAKSNAPSFPTLSINITEVFLFTTNPTKTNGGHDIDFTDPVYNTPEENTGVTTNTNIVYTNASNKPNTNIYSTTSSFINTATQIDKDVNKDFPTISSSNGPFTTATHPTPVFNLNGISSKKPTANITLTNFFSTTSNIELTTPYNSQSTEDRAKISEIPILKHLFTRQTPAIMTTLDQNKTPDFGQSDENNKIGLQGKVEIKYYFKMFFNF